MEHRSIVMVVATHDKFNDERSKVPYSIAKKFTEAAVTSGDTVDVINLYNDEFGIYPGVESGRDPQIVGYQKRLQEADLIVCIYPLHFNTPPAIFKAFLERVLTPGYAFRYTKGRYQPILNDKECLVLATSETHNGARWFEYGNTHKIWWQRTIKSQLGWDVDIREFGSIRAASDADIQKWYTKVEDIAQQKKTPLKWLDWF